MIYTLYKLTSRNLKLYLKDKATVFFSLMAPMIVLLLYILFIGNLQTDSLKDIAASIGITTADKQIKAFCDSWMLSGVMACACITVPLAACGIMIQDKQRGIIADTLAAPIPKWLPYCGYLIATICVAIIICLIVLFVCLIYIVAVGSWYLSFMDIIGCIGSAILSIISSSFIVILIANLIKTESAFSAINAIIGTCIGFLIGAYMPISIFPKPVQYMTLFIPGSYSAGLFKNFFMRGTTTALETVLPQQMVDEFVKNYNVEMDFFGISIDTPIMAAILCGFLAIFVVINLLVLLIKKNKKLS